MSPEKPPRQPEARVPRPRIRKLPARWAGVLMPLVLSIFMTLIISGIATWNSIGFSGAYAHEWMTAWGLSWLIAFPTLLLVLPLVRRIVAAMVEAPAR